MRPIGAVIRGLDIKASSVRVIIVPDQKVAIFTVDILWSIL